MVIRLSSLGDVLLTFPVIAPLAAATGVRPAFVTREEWAPVVGRHPNVGSIYTIASRGDAGDNRVSACVRRINDDLRPDFVLDLHGVPLARYIASYILAPEKATYAKMGIRRTLFALTGIDTLPKLTVSVIDAYAKAARPWGVREADRSFRVPLDAARTAVVRGRLGYDAGYIAFAPGARHGAKAWPLERWRAIARALVDRGRKVLLLGDAREKDGCEAIALGSPAVINAAGMVATADIFETLAGAAALVSNDSAWVHVAPLVDVPCVALFGPTTPRFGFGPWGTLDRAVYLGVPCSPCSKHGARPCWRTRRFCMEDILPDAVVGILEATGALA